MFKAKKIPKEVMVSGPIKENEHHYVDAGQLKASIGDFIINDGKNTYPIKPTIFYESYVNIPNNIENISHKVTVNKKPIEVDVHGPIEEEKEIKTLEGVVKAPKGYYIITGIDGEKYSLSPNEFRDNYQKIV